MPKSFYKNESKEDRDKRWEETIKLVWPLERDELEEDEDSGSDVECTVDEDEDMVSEYEEEIYLNLNLTIYLKRRP